MTALIHCSYHKCLTVYFSRVMSACVSRFGGYHHFNSDLAAFHERRHDYRVASVNNHALDLDSFGDVRVSRFVRDPRDLIVSGYFYHRRGAERWCRIQSPSEHDWVVVNGHRPSGMGEKESLAEYLERLDQDDGLIAEMEFRELHFASMREWNGDDERVRVWRYEDVLGNEAKVMAEVAAHYELPLPLRLNARRHGRRFAAKRIDRSADRHVRDPTAGQWRKVFSPKVEAAFDKRWGDLPGLLGYE